MTPTECSTVDLGVIAPYQKYEKILNNLLKLMQTVNIIGRHGNTMLGLLDLVEHIKDRVNTMVEIGSFRGESTSLFARTINKVYAIDPFTWCSGTAETDFDNLTKDFTNITKIKKYSNDPEVLNQFEDKSLDFVYIDGDHSYNAVMNDIKNWIPKIKDNGLIGGHDYHTGLLDVVNAVNNSFNTNNGKLFKDSSWVFNKNDYIR